MIVIHHNPGCGTSRNVLEMIRDAGIEPIVVNYVKEGWTRPQLLALFAAADLTPREALRSKNTPAEELGLLKDGVADDTIIQAMIDQPLLVERPIVASPKGIRLCRPKETVLDLLYQFPEGAFYKEDGELVIDDKGDQVG